MIRASRSSQPSPAATKRTPRVGPIAEEKRDLEAALRQQRAEPLGPLDQRDPLAEGVLDAELPSFFRGFEAVEVDMPDRRLGQFIDLHEGEGWARHLLLATARADKGAGKAGLAAAEITLQCDDVTRRSQRGYSGGEPCGRGFIGQIDDGHRLCVV